MLFNELTVPFIVVAMFGYVTAGSEGIPSCEPPALRCSILKRSVCEWSDSGKPVWACRGFFEKVNNGPKPKPGDDEDVIIKTFEYKVPQGTGKSVSQNVSESNGVQYVTYTIPIGKSTRSTSTKVESENEVNIGTYTLPVSSGNSSSEASSISGSRSIGNDSYSEVRTFTYQLPTIKKISGSNVEVGSDVKIGTYALPLTSKKSINDSDEVRIETYTIRIPINKKSSESTVESDSEARITGTYTLPVPGSNKIAHEEENSDVEVRTYTYEIHEIPSNKTSSLQKNSGSGIQVGTLKSPVSSGRSISATKLEPESEMQVGAYTIAKSNSWKADGVESDSDVQTVTYTYRLPSIKNSSSSQGTSDDSVLTGTYTISSKNVGNVQNDSRTDAQIGTYLVPTSTTSSSPESESESGLMGTYTYKVSSGKSSGSSNRTDPESNVHFVTYQIASGKNTVNTTDDPESKSLASQSNITQQANSDTQSHAASDVSGTSSASSTSSISSLSDANLRIGIHEVQPRSGSSDSQSQDQTQSNVNSLYSVAENSGVQPGSESYLQLRTQSISSGKTGSSALNADSEAPLGVETDRNSKTGDTQTETGVKANGEVQTNQASSVEGLQRLSTADASGFRIAGHQASEMTGLGKANLGRGQYSSSSNRPSNQQYFQPVLPTSYSAPQYHHTGDSQYVSGERSLVENNDKMGETGNQMASSRISGNYGYLPKIADGSQPSENQAYSMGHIMSPYHVIPDKAAAPGGQYYQANSARGSGGVHQNYGIGTQNRPPPYYPGYWSSAQGSSSAPLKPENGMYFWPHYWTPALNMRPRVGANWLVGHKTPLTKPAFIAIAPQNMALSGLYGSRSLNPASEGTAISSAFPHQNPWVYYMSPFAHYFPSTGLGTADSTVCSFCKKLMSIVGGAKICDHLEPIILEFFNKVIEILRKRLN